MSTVAASTRESTETAPSWLTEFVPPRRLRSGHLQTLVGNFLRREWWLPEPERMLTPVADPEAEAAGYAPSRLLSLCHWQPEPRSRLTVLILHGLEGSADSRYVLGNGSRAWAAGCNVVRMNMRSCGGSDALAPTIYHSGRSEDVAAVVEAVVRERGLERIALVGYSMGGNLVLKYVGEGAAAQVKAVACVSPLMDLSASSAALHEPQNRLYEQRFLRAMKRRLRAKAALFPALYGGLEREGVYRRIRTLRDFDEQIVARYGGFRDAEDYYASVASSRWAYRLGAPTLILHALDDPFIRVLDQTAAALRANPKVTYIETEHGGHCAFLSALPPGTRRGSGRRSADAGLDQAGVGAIGDRHWAERTLLGYLLATT